MSASSSFPRFFARVEFGGRRFEVALAPASEADVALVRSAVAVAASPRDLVELLRACPLSGFCGVREVPALPPFESFFEQWLEEQKMRS